MKYKKFFVSPSKEQAWLNTMAQSGFVFVNRVDSCYYFEQDENAASLSYKVEFLELVADTDESRAYFKQREMLDEHFVCSCGLKAYFVTKGSFSAETDLKSASTHRIYLRDRAMLFGSIYFTVLGLLAYNLIKWVQFDAMGTNGTDSLSALKKILPDLSSVFGNYPTTPLITLLLILLLLAFVPTFWYVEEYIGAKRIENKLKKVVSDAYGTESVLESDKENTLNNDSQTAENSSDFKFSESNESNQK